MNEAWQTENARYLGLAVEWLRLRLLRLAPHRMSPPDALPPPMSAHRPSLIDWWHGRHPNITPDVPLLAPAPQASDEEIARVGDEIATLERNDIPPALIMLSRQLGLSKFEAHVLLLCVAMELDTRIAGLCARAQDDSQRGYPTFAL